MNIIASARKSGKTNMVYGIKQSEINAALLLLESMRLELAIYQLIRDTYDEKQEARLQRISTASTLRNQRRLKTLKDCQES